MPLDQLTQTMPQAGKKLEKSKKQEKDVVVINPKINNMIEEKESTAVMAFGRFNPPTIGHEKLIHKVADVAKEHGGSAHVIASHSENKSKDPLPQDKKIGYLKKVAPEAVHVSGSSKEEPSFLHAAKKLHDAGHKHLVMVAGSDRVKEYEERLHHYNGKEGHYHFKSIKVVSSGERDPDAEGVEGMSGTKMRAHARAGEMDKFKSGLPKSLHPHADEIADHIKSIKEDVELDERVLNVQQRKERGIQMRRRAVRMAVARRIARQRLAADKVLGRRSRTTAKQMIRTRFAGQRGASYQTLAPSDKMNVDRTIDKKVGLVKKIAKRLMPIERQRELQRFMSVKTGQKRAAPAPIPLVMGEDINTLFAQTFRHELREEEFNVVSLHSQNQITEKSLGKLIDVSESNDIPLEVLEQVMLRGIHEWYEDPRENRSAEQTGFNRVFSFINGGGARTLDEDLLEGLRDPKDNPCWKGYKPVGTKKKAGREVPNCVPEENNVKEGNLSWHKVAAVRSSTGADLTGQKMAQSSKEFASRMGLDKIPGILAREKERHEKFYKSRKEETQIDEISKEKKMRYVAKAAASTHEPKEGEKQSDYLERLHKRMSGIKKALSSMNPSQRFQKEENGAGEEGTTKLKMKYKKDTPGQCDEAKTPAWSRKEGKNPTGGLNAKGIASYRRENPGSKLSMAVTTKPSKLKKGSKSYNRRKSFCARMSGVEGPMKDEKGRPTRKALALRKWNC